VYARDQATNMGTMTLTSAPTADASVLEQTPGQTAFSRRDRRPAEVKHRTAQPGQNRSEEADLMAAKGKATMSFNNKMRRPHLHPADAASLQDPAR